MIINEQIVTLKSSELISSCCNNAHLSSFLLSTTFLQLFRWSIRQNQLQNNDPLHTPFFVTFFFSFFLQKFVWWAEKNLWMEVEEIEHNETLGALAEGDENNRILDDVEYY